MAITLTNAVTGQADVNRLLREINSLDDFFVGAEAREAGSSQTPPKTTQLLEELAKANKLSLLEAKDRAKLTKALNEVIKTAPKIQVSFAVEPPPRVVETILGWMRENLHPNVLLQIGLQPNIGAGVVLRTANREFDLSMRQHLIDSRPYLAQLIETVVKTLPAESVAAPVSAAPVAQPPTSPQTRPGPAPHPVPSAPAPQQAAAPQPAPAAQPAQRRIEVNHG